MSFLEGKVDALSSDIKDPYTLAITSYALSLVGSRKKIKALKELRKMAIEKGKENKNLLLSCAILFDLHEDCHREKSRENEDFSRSGKKSEKFFDFVRVSEKSGALLVKSNTLRTKAKRGKRLKRKRKISMARKKS